MTQTLVRVATCTAQPGPLGKTELSGPAVKCLLPDGVTVGYVTFVDAYLSDQPITSGSGGATGGGAEVNVTADIFVGAVLVLCVALGWIAGGQR